MKAIKIVVGANIISVIFSAMFAALGFFDGIYINGTSYYQWDAYWVIFAMSMLFCTGTWVITALIGAVVGWMLD